MSGVRGRRCLSLTRGSQRDRKGLAKSFQDKHRRGIILVLVYFIDFPIGCA